MFAALGDRAGYALGTTPHDPGGQSDRYAAAAARRRTLRGNPTQASYNEVVDEATDDWISIPSSMLPTPERLYDPPCMANRSAPVTISPGAQCCWFHRGDWAIVNRRLAEALTIFETLDCEDDFISEIGRQLEQAGFTTWEREAADSLPAWPINLNADFGDYANGQHRSQAMIDQHVDLAVVTWHRFDETVPQGVRRFDV